MTQPRYSVYFIPADDSALAQWGMRVLGRDANAQAIEPWQPDHPSRLPLIQRAAHYGFHATIKAPFELADGLDVEALKRRVEALCCTLQPVPLQGLAVRALGAFTALALPGNGQTPAVNALAEQVVRELDDCRAPMTAADRQRRQPERLTDAQRSYLDRWGYPYVLDEFRFHMTLSSHAAAASKPIDMDGYREWLTRGFQEQVTGTPVLDRLALCVQNNRETPFRRLCAWQLG